MVPPVFAEPMEPPADLQEGLRELVDREFMNSPQYAEQFFRANAEGAHPKIIEFRGAFLRRMEAMGIPMFASEVWRTHERQQELYDKGNSKARPGESPHNWGCAIDLVHSVHGWGLTKEHWKLVGHVGKDIARTKGLGLVWGGDWQFYDPAHWEVKDWRSVAAVLTTRPELMPSVPAALSFIKEASAKRAG